MRRVLLAIVVASPAHASPWTMTGETGAEYDTNVQRVETGPSLDTAPVASPVFRIGARADDRDKLLGGNFVFGVSDLTRIVADSDVSVENVTVLAGALRWLHPIGDHAVAAGVDLSAIDAFGLSDAIGDRTFRILAGDGMVTMRSGDDRRLTFAFGARAFTYKPDHDYDYQGPAANARFDMTLWQPPDHTKSLELAATAGFEARDYAANALVNACAPGAPPDPMCAAATDLSRRDRFQHAGFELTWVGRQIFALGYQLTVIDSNSYGESLARHTVTASATTELPKRIYVTLLGILQIDQYLDGLVIQTDLQHMEFTNIEDENRSTLQLRVARKLTPEWSVEGRAAIWRNLARSSMELAFERELVYAGVVYTR